MSTMMTGYVFANEIKASSDAKISGTAARSSIAADQNKITVSSAKISIKNASVTGVTDKNWTGKAIKQIPVVRVKGRTLKRGTDYTVAYFNNKNVGTSKVVIKGKGKYTGTVTKSFYIKPRGTTITVLKRKGNRMTVKSVVFKMPKALANRLMHIEVEGNFKAWKKWAVMNVSSSAGYIYPTMWLNEKYGKKITDLANVTTLDGYMAAFQQAAAKTIGVAAMLWQGIIWNYLNETRQWYEREN